MFKNYNQKSDNQTINAKNEDCLFIIASMIVLRMSAVAVAYSRYSGQYGFEEMFVSRYRFISVTLLCLSYLFALSLINNGNFRRLLLVVFYRLLVFCMCIHIIFCIIIMLILGKN